jgi:hypothetical protein
MKKKTLLLFQLFLLIFAFYALLSFSGSQRLLVSLGCLLGMLVIGKVETSVTEPSSQEEGRSSDMGKKDEAKSASQALDCLVKSKNVLLLTDAIHYLMQDLGLAVSPSPDLPAIDRLVTLPGTEITFGLKIISDVTELNGVWDKWEELASFDLGKGGRRRLLIIGSSSIKEAAEGDKKYRNFSVEAREMLSARHVVAMTTLTLYKIYLLCKKKKVGIKRIFRPIQQHPGGVFKLERSAR